MPIQSLEDRFRSATLQEGGVNDAAQGGPTARNAGQPQRPRYHDRAVSAHLEDDQGE